MDVSVTMLRAELATWLDRVRDGEQIVVTERGEPIARLVPVTSAPLLDQLVRSGVLSKPRSLDRPSARSETRVPALRSVSEVVGEQRD